MRFFFWMVLGLTAMAGEAPFDMPGMGSVFNEDGFHSSGVAWCDYDGDGHVDLFVANPDNVDNALYRNVDGLRFERVSAGPLVNDAGFSSGAVWGDYDNDGRPDLYVSNQMGQDNFLYRNLGQGRFERVRTGEIAQGGGDSYSAAWGDFDNDGFLDLYVANNYKEANLFFHNDGKGGFRRIREGAPATDVFSSYSPTWIDYDGDGDLDLFVVNYAVDEPNNLYRNLGEGRFEAVTDHVLTRGKAQSNGAAWGDFDNDGDADLFVSNGGYGAPGEQVDWLFRNDGDGRFEQISVGPLVNTPGSSLTAQWGDYDNDGDLDLFTAVFRQDNRLHRNDGGSLIPVTRGGLVRFGGYSDGAGWADADGDGALDLFVTNWQHADNWLYTNRGNDNGWLAVIPRGTTSNSMAIGARVVLEQGEGDGVERQTRFIQSQTGGRGQNATGAHFGLGENSDPATVTIHWPSGKTTSRRVDQFKRTLYLDEDGGVRERLQLQLPKSAVGQMFSAYGQGDGAFARCLQGLLEGTPHRGHFHPPLVADLLLNLYTYGDEQKALAAAREAVGVLGESAAVHFALAEILRQQGEKQTAAQHYRRAAELLPREEKLAPRHRAHIARVTAAIR